MRRFLALILGLSLLSAPARMVATEVETKDPVQQCLRDITGRVAQQQRIFRSVLLGRQQASVELEGTTRFDEAGQAWIKTGENRWVSATGDPIEDAELDARTEWEGINDPSADASLRSHRPGLLEVREALTSDLLPGVIESYRALRCRLSMVCAGLQAGPDDPSPLTVQTPGCEPLTMEPIRSCQFANAAKDPEGSSLALVDPQGQSTVRVHCGPLIEQVARDEARMVSLAVSYDASVRSILQFAGQFDSFIDSWRSDVLTPLDQTVSLVHQLSRIPCFLAQCTNE